MEGLQKDENEKLRAEIKTVKALNGLDAINGKAVGEMNRIMRKVAEEANRASSTAALSLLK